MHLLQVDVTTAFLYGEIYVVLPGELRTTAEIEERLIRKLLKSLYGTPSAPHMWYTVLSTQLQKINLV